MQSNLQFSLRLNLKHTPLDGLYDIIDIVHDLTRRKPYYPDTQRLKGLLSLDVVPGNLRIIVRDAVHFHSDPQGTAVEVHDVIEDDELPVERVPMNLFASQLRPEATFALGHALAQASGHGFQTGIVGRPRHEREYGR